VAVFFCVRAVFLRPGGCLDPAVSVAFQVWGTEFGRAGSRLFSPEAMTTFEFFRLGLGHLVPRISLRSRRGRRNG
jgi:hypothetical protein